MSDGEMIAICRRIDKHNQAIIKLIDQIAESEHPNAYECSEDLFAQCAQYAWARHVVEQYLEHPERWETGDYGIRRKVQP